MPNKPKTRLYVPEPLHAGAVLELHGMQANKLLGTLRARVGDAVSVFNGESGEWLAEITHSTKRSVQLAATEQSQPQRGVPDVWLIFAPVKNEKVDFLVRRAVELGVARLQPVITQHTIARRVNVERLQANAVEAAEQCGRMEVPPVEEPLPFLRLLQQFPAGRILLFCDEGGAGKPLKQALPALPNGAYAVIIGPEGGFTREEREMLLAREGTTALSLGPRILRAETAALAALANIMAWVGDWEQPSHFTPDE